MRNDAIITSVYVSDLSYISTSIDSLNFWLGSKLESGRRVFLRGHVRSSCSIKTEDMGSHTIEARDQYRVISPF